MIQRASLLLIIFSSFFMGVWSADYSMQGYILFGFLSMTAALNVSRYGANNQETAKVFKGLF